MLSKQKTLGNLSPDHLGRTLAIVDELDSIGTLYDLLKEKPRFRRLIESPRVKFSWSIAYEFEYKFMMGALIWVVGEQATVDRLTAAADKHEEFLRMAEEDPAP